MAASSTDQAAAGDAKPGRESNRIQVSATKKPMYFYVTLSKRLLKEHDEVALSALGTAVSTMVSVAEILKKEGFVVEKGLSTELEGIEDREGDGTRPPRPAFKPKMTVVLGKSEAFDAKMAEEAAAAKERAAARKEKAAAAPAAGDKAESGDKEDEEMSEGEAK